MKSNFIDTSPLYQLSETRIGLALQPLLAADSTLRSRLVICSKVGDKCPPYSENGGFSPFSKDGVRSSVLNSLKNLQIEKLDVCLLHDPTLREVEEFLKPIVGGFEGLRELREEEKVDFFGIGCVEHEVQKAFVNGVPPKDCSVLLTVNDFNLVRRYAASGDEGEKESPFELAAERDIGVMNAGALYMGLLAEPRVAWNEGFRKEVLVPHYKKVMELALEMEEWVNSLQEDGHKTCLKNLALRFAIFGDERVTSVPVGCRNAKEVDEMIDAIEFIEDEEKRLWEKFETKFEKKILALDCWKDHWRYNKETTKV